VQVYEAVDGQIEIRYRDRVMRYTEFSAETRAAHRALARPPAPAATPRPSPTGRRRGQQSPDHPWRAQVYDTHQQSRQLAKDRRAWQRAQP
jgi:hypothetical protein